MLKSGERVRCHTKVVRAESTLNSCSGLGTSQYRILILSLLQEQLLVDHLLLQNLLLNLLLCLLAVKLA